MRMPAADSDNHSVDGINGTEMRSEGETSHACSAFEAMLEVGENQICPASPLPTQTPTSHYNSTDKKAFLRKGEGRGWNSSKASHAEIADGGLSSKERLEKLEKMQQVHLQKLEQRMKQKDEWQPIRRQLVKKSSSKENEASGEQIQTTQPPLATQPGHMNGCATERCIKAKETERKDNRDAEKSRNCISEDSVIEHGTIIDDDKVQVQRLNRRLENALREAERERQAVSCTLRDPLQLNFDFWGLFDKLTT